MNVYPEDKHSKVGASGRCRTRGSVEGDCFDLLFMAKQEQQYSTILAHILRYVDREKKPATCCSKKTGSCCPPPPPKFSPYRPKLQGWHVCSHITITPTFIPLYWRHNSLATRRAASGADEIGWLGALWLVLLFSRPNSHIQTQLTWSWCATTITTSGCTSDCYVCYIQHIFI
jgi:hypothetical protein